MTMKNVLITSLILFFTSVLLADSPLTSTDIAKAYMDESIVMEANETSGILTENLMEYLYNKKNPIQVKIALINKIGWNFEGNNNVELFYTFLKKKKKKLGTYQGLITKGRWDLQICMAYIQALSNYFDVNDALQMADKAAKKVKNSYTVQLVRALIKAQKLFDSSWCDVYQTTHKVRTNKTLHKDLLRKEAVEDVFKYMDLYKSSCKDDPK